MESAAQERCPPPPNPSTDENSNPAPPAAHEPAAPRAPSRTPFTSLSQVEADLALAHVLQEQERAYMMLSWNGGGRGDGGSDYGSSEEDYEEDYGRAERGHPEEGSDYGEEEEGDHEDGEPELDRNDFESNEAYAQALQEAEGWGIAARLMALAGLGGRGAEHHEEHHNDAQDAWDDVDPDEYSYEELVALGEVVGTESRGLSADIITSLPSFNYKAESTQDGNTDQCVICRLEYEDGESLVALSCKHAYHPECINKWLQINKVCPVCNTEVSASENRLD